MKSTNKETFEYAKKYIPGGVNSPLRGFNDVGGKPICVKSAKGAYIYDVEDKKYVDFLLGFGPVILGHAPENVINSVNEQIKKGSVYAATNVLEIELAKLIVESTPCVEKVRFVCSGTEAVMSAVRLAKGYTGREMVLKFDGSYHGHCDSVLGQPIDTLDNRTPVKGIDKGINQNTIVVQYNDLAATTKAFEKYGEEIACILVEPYACNMGLVKPKVEFIQGLKKLCEQYNALLIFDEVITGFRMTYGSVYRDFLVEPDLITFGKVIGGGAPIGAYAGKEHIMKLVYDEEQGVYQSGTFAGNALSMAAGIAVVSELKKGEVYKELEEKGEFLETLVTKAFRDNDIPYLFNRKGAVFSFLLNKECNEINSFLDVKEQDFDLFAKVFEKMLEKGFLLAPSADEVMHLCTSHTKEDITNFVTSFVDAIKLISKERRV